MYLFFSFDATILVNKDVYISLKSGNCDALQLEPLDVAPMVPRFNYVARIAPAAYSKFSNSTTSTDPCTGVLKLTQSSNTQQLSYRQYLANFPRPFIRGTILTWDFSRGRASICAKFGEDVGQSSSLAKFEKLSDILLRFETRAA